MIYEFYVLAGSDNGMDSDSDSDLCERENRVSYYFLYQH